MENYNIKTWPWEDGDGSDSVKWAGRRKTGLISSVCFGHWMSEDGVVKMSLLLSILGLEYELSVKVVEYYLEE